MCARWEESFEAFLQDIGHRPGLNYSLDRIDPNGNYEPANCRWVEIRVQNRNRRGVRWYEFEGQLALIGDIARFFGISRSLALSLERRGLLPARRLPEAPVVPDKIESLVLDLTQASALSELDCIEAAR
jgi:hypothetical protein